MIKHKIANVALVGILILASFFGGLNLFNQNKTTQEAQAALNCPAGYTPNGGQCQRVEANKVCPSGTVNTNDGRCSTVASYSCPSGGDVSGSNCNVQRINGWIVSEGPNVMNVAVPTLVDLVPADGSFDQCNGGEPFGYIPNANGGNERMGLGNDGFYYCTTGIHLKGGGSTYKYLTAKRYSLSYAASTT